MHSIRLLSQLSLQKSVFLGAQVFSFESCFNNETSLAAATILHLLLTSPDSLDLPQLHPLLLSQLSNDTSAKARLFLAAALTPYRASTFLEGGKKRTVVAWIIRDGLKLGVQNHYLDGIPSLFSAAELLNKTSLSDLIEKSQRVQIGS